MDEGAHGKPMITVEQAEAEHRKLVRLEKELLALDGEQRAYWMCIGGRWVAANVLGCRASLSQSLEETLEETRAGMLADAHLIMHAVDGTAQVVSGPDSVDSVNSE